jgi:predicted outer membrane repeat protein
VGCTFSENFASSNGSAIAAFEHMVLNVVNTTIVRNTAAGSRGAIFFKVHPSFPGKAALILRKKYSSSRKP